MSGGDRPTLFASHQRALRACSISLWPPQLRRSGEYEIQMCAPESVIGRWISAKLPSMRRGSSAASLSSGCMTRPQRSKLTEVLGERERDAGAALAERGVRDRRTCPSSVDERDARVLDAPQLLGIVLGIGAQRRLRVDRPSRRRRSPSAPRRGASGRAGPRRGRAAASCRPASRVAPALKTVCAGYGQSAAVRIGLLCVPVEERLVARRGVMRSCADGSPAAEARRSPGVQRASIGAHLEQREQERERRLRALVLVHAIGVQPVAAAAGRRRRRATAAAGSGRGTS